MDPGTDRVGVVGLGAMGRPMTEHLLRRPTRRSPSTAADATGTPRVAL